MVTDPSLFDTLSDSQTKKLLQSITDGNCILVLGPNVNLMADGRPLKAHLAKYLIDNLGIDLLSSEDVNSLDYVIGKALQTNNPKKIRTYIEEFYADADLTDNRDTAIFNSILELGFPIIFNADPDMAMFEVLRRNNIEAYGNYFNFLADPKTFEKTGEVLFPELRAGYTPSVSRPDKDNPLVLNLFGAADNDNVWTLPIGPQEQMRLLYNLTSSESVEYIFKKIGGQLKQCKHFLFIGFNFHSWALSFIFYFINSLTKDVNTLQVTLGFHVDTFNEPFKEAQKLFYKNLRSDILINNENAYAFLQSLKDAVSASKSNAKTSRRTLFILCHNGISQLFDDRDKSDVTLFDSFKKSLMLSEDLNLDIQSNIPGLGLRELPDDKIMERIKTSDYTLFLLSANALQDEQYVSYLRLWEERKSQNRSRVMLGLMEDCNWEALYPTSGPQFWKLLNQNLPVLGSSVPETKQRTEGLRREVERFIKESAKL